MSTISFKKNTGLLAILPVLLLFACQDAPPAETAESGAPEAAATDQIELTAEQIRISGIVSAEPVMRQTTQMLPVTGELRVHNEYIATVSAWSEGIVESMHTGLNKPVRKGDVVAVLWQPQLLDLQQEYLETLDRLRFLEAEFERYRTLQSDNATALKTLQKAESELREAQTRRDLLGAKLRLYHIDPVRLRSDQVSGTVRLVAPVNGIITRTFLTAGSAVQSGSPICEIVDVSKMHADLFVFEKDLGKVHVGQTASIRVSGGGGPMVPAKVFSIDPSVDQERKAVRLHASYTKPPSGAIVNGAYLEAHIDLQGSASLPAVPVDAVVQEGDKHYVFVVQEETPESVVFRKVAVRVQPAGDDYLAFEAIDPMPEQPRIVTKGAYYVSAQGTGVAAEE